MHKGSAAASDSFCLAPGNTIVETPETTGRILGTMNLKICVSKRQQSP